MVAYKPTFTELNGYTVSVQTPCRYPRLPWNVSESAAQELFERLESPASTGAVNLEFGGFIREKS